jgi:hypothetical protein
MTSIVETGSSGTSSRLLKATSELRELNKVMRAPAPDEVDPRVLHDFREAMDHVRLTSWAAQQWLHQYRLDGNPETALSILTAERIRRATQLNFELSEDLEQQEEPLDRHRLEKLYAAVERLYMQLHRTLGKDKSAS